MKSELRLCDHAVIPGAKVIEVWYAGEFIATVVGADGPGVRVLSKHPMESEYSTPVAGSLPGVIKVTIKKMVCTTCKSKPGMFREAYDQLDAIRSKAGYLSSLFGRLLEQRDAEAMDRIATIANRQIGRLMDEWDKDRKAAACPAERDSQGDDDDHSRHS